MAVRSKGRMVRGSLEVGSSREIRVRDEAFEKLKMRSSQEMEVWKRVVYGRRKFKKMRKLKEISRSKEKRSSEVANSDEMRFQLL